MRAKVRFVLGCMVFIWSGLVYGVKYQKLAQTGFQFLSVVSDARGVGMGEAMTGLGLGSSGLFFNPAGMVEMESSYEVSVSTNRWIADISHYTMSYGMQLGRYGEYGVMGLSGQVVDYGDFYGTMVDKSSEKGYKDTEIFGLSAWAIGIGYGKRLTDRFSVGGQVRVVRQELGRSRVPEVRVVGDTVLGLKENALMPLAFDFGTRFKTGVKSLVFGMSVRNFSKEVKYVQEGFQLPLVFNLGVSMDLLDVLRGKVPGERMELGIEASHYRDHAEQVKVGIEYEVVRGLMMRCGYKSSEDEGGLSFGIGVRGKGLGLDYAYTPYGVFERVQRMTVRFAW